MEHVVLAPQDMRMAARIVKNKLGDLHYGIPVQYRRRGLVELDDEVVMANEHSSGEHKTEQASLLPRLQEIVCAFSPFQQHAELPSLKLTHIPDDFQDKEICLDVVQIIHEATMVPVFSWCIAKSKEANTNM